MTLATPRRWSPELRDQIYEALLDSIIDNPDQLEWADDRAAATKKIAKRFRCTVQQVAGVRAALTLGTYGDMDRLIANRKRQLRKLANST